ncbi:MAG: FHA domain-containing protein, partial [Vicinamibacterales bacterium]
MATLAVYRGDQFLRRVELGEAPTRIGRAAENDLVLEDRDKGVSRTHAEIRYEGGRYVVVDLNSQNGVWLGDRRVTRDPLPVDVAVAIGPYRLVLAGETPAPPASASSAAPLSSREGDEASAEATEPARSSVQVSPTQVTPAQVVAPPAPKRGNRLLVASLAAVGIVAAALVFAAVVSRSSDPPPPVTVNPGPPPPPAGPSPEEGFQDRYRQAQEHIGNGDKAAALAANTDALNVLPEDARGLEQRTAIEAMSDSTALSAEDPSGGSQVETPDIAPPTTKPVPSVQSTLRVARVPGERASQRETREKNARFHLDDGKKALEERRYDTAIGLFQAALDTSGRPDYGYTANEASERLQSARSAKARDEAEQRRAAAQKLVEEAKALAGSDVVGAIRRLLEARKLDPQVAGVSEPLKGLQEQARA